MKNVDKFLLGIVIGSVILVAVVLALAFLRPKPAYLSEDTPQGVANNYLLALRQEDYARAYSYVSQSIPGYPHSVTNFKHDIQSFSWMFRLDQDVTLAVTSTVVNGNNATATVRETRFYQGGLVSNEDTSSFDIQLVHDAASAKWIITQADSYWANCWNNTGGCK